MSKIKQMGLGFILVMGILWVLFLNNTFGLPDVAYLKTENPTITAFMQRYDGAKPIQHQWVPFAQISPYLKEAVVLAEDDRFFEHGGLDWEAIKTAAKKNWERKEFRWGASTITQQVAKNLFLSPSKNPFRKIKEMLISFQLEKNLSKQRILEIYLNVAEWGEGIFGAQAAAKHYYNTNARRLGPTQACWLAAILPNPRFYQTHPNGRFIDKKIRGLLKMMGY